MGEVQNTLFTWQALLELSGALAMTYILVQIFGLRIEKAFQIREWPFSTEIFAVFVGAFVLVISQIALEPAMAKDWRIYVLGFLNGALVSYLSGRMNDKALINEQKKTEWLEGVSKNNTTKT